MSLRRVSRPGAWQHCGQRVREAPCRIAFEHCSQPPNVGNDFAQAARYGASLGLNYPNTDNRAGLAAPLFALAGTACNFSLSFEGARISTAALG